MSTNLNLNHLKEYHPRLPVKTALEYAHRAALGLQRHGHTSGAAMRLQCENVRIAASISWVLGSENGQTMLDYNRITEDAAEAIALAISHVHFGWELRRRLQRGESGDWLFLDKQQQFVALEVSGVDQLDDGARLRAKTKQILRTAAVMLKAVCIVELAPPRATMRHV